MTRGLTKVVRLLILYSFKFQEYFQNYFQPFFQEIWKLSQVIPPQKQHEKLIKELIKYLGEVSQFGTMN